VGPVLIDGVTDLHVHGAPSLVARHATDADTVVANAQVGVTLSVLKAHEGSTAERALAVGPSAVGGIVLNSPVGGANPDAVEVAARFGARMVWMPTLCSPAHRAASRSPELAVHRGLDFREVPILQDGALAPAWHEVLEVIVAHDLVLSSGHLTCAESLVLFRAARAAGVTRMVFTHPVLPFLGWDLAAVPELRALGVHLELSILPDILVDGRGPDSIDLAEQYPTELLVFGGDLGHADHPTLAQALPDWLGELASRIGDDRAERILTSNGRTLLGR
jgi:hypothetical protein